MGSPTDTALKEFRDNIAAIQRAVCELEQVSCKNLGLAVTQQQSSGSPFLNARISASRPSGWEPAAPLVCRMQRWTAMMALAARLTLKRDHQM